jgi:hypothetical protein
MYKTKIKELPYNKNRRIDIVHKDSQGDSQTPKKLVFVL